MISNSIFIVYQSYRRRILIAWRPMSLLMWPIWICIPEFMEDIRFRCKEANRQQAWLRQSRHRLIKEVIKTADTNIQSLSKVIDTTKLEEQFAFILQYFGCRPSFKGFDFVSYPINDMWAMKKTWFFRVYRGWNTTQLPRDQSTWHSP